MISSPYATKFTRMQMQGHKSPEVDMTNRKALERPARKAAWEARKAKEKK